MSVDDSVPAAGVLLALLAFFFSLLCLAPLVWHIKSRNLAASCLVGWVLISNFLCFIDVLIWPNDDFVGRFDGVGLCDIQVKLQVARSTALPAATLCIIKSLADVMNPNRINLVPSRAQRLRKSGLELALCVAVPILTMILHFIVQYGRYSIIGISGCNATYLKSWVTVVLLSLPPLLLSFWQSYYCCLILYRLHKHRQMFSGLLQASKTSKARFIRLLVLAIVLLLVLLPTEIVLLTLNVPRETRSFTWSAGHGYEVWHSIALVPSHGVVFADRWIVVGCGFLVFVTLGLGQEAKAAYRAWLTSIGLSSILPSPKSSATNSHTSSGIPSLGRRAKLLIVPKRWSKRPETMSETTLSSPVEDIKMSPMSKKEHIVEEELSV